MARSIPLTKGHYTLVDDEDYAWLSQWDWHAGTDDSGSVYAVRNVHSGDRAQRRKVLMHRQILGLPLEGNGPHADHKNRDTLDNRRTNLRSCPPSQNMGNQKLRFNNTSGFKGVCWEKRDRKWVARIGRKEGDKYLRVTLGRFKNKEDAARAYDVAALEYFGEFAALNFPLPQRGEPVGV